MAKKKSNTKWWILGIVGAGGLYLLWQNSKQAQPTTPALTPTPTPAPALPGGQAAFAPGTTPVIPIQTQIQAAPTPPPAATVVAPTATVSPVSANPPTILSSGGPIQPGETTDAGVPYDPRMSTLQTWAQTTMNSCDLARWNSDQMNFTADEWNGLYDIYFNDWIGGQGGNATRTAFWNAWRSKYQILTNTPC